MILQVPGDKSITQRALIFAALSEGESELSGLLYGADPLSTAGALRALGVDIPAIPTDGSAIRVVGRGLRGLLQPDGPLDFGNSGTGARLMLGVLSGQPIEAELTGDASLRSRPMRRVTDPLGRMGARFDEKGELGRLPIRTLGGTLHGVEMTLPVASAQVKSALLLAGLTGGVQVTLVEPGRSRDHTERMLAAYGCTVEEGPVEGGWRVALVGSSTTLHARALHVPGDFSSAAFFIVLGVLGGAGPALTIADVGLNPTRTGLMPLLARMGVESVGVEEAPGEGTGERVGSITPRPSELHAMEMGEEDVPQAIDEIPLVAVAAARARGVTRIRGASELRHKETDRIHAMVTNLRAVGVEVQELEDGLVVHGSDRTLEGTVRSFDDHRIAMAFGILGALPGNRIEVEGAQVVDVSYPTFWSDLARVVEARDEVGGGGRPTRTDRRAVVTLDGPAGSGKSTTAREVARRLGYRHLDSGSLYRALTLALLERGDDPATWPSISAEALGELGIRVEPTERGMDILLGDRVLGDELRSGDVTRHVSQLASLPAVRDWLLDAQRSAGAGGGLVADGRDMGTVVFPDADVKIFVTAALDERARRRLKESGAGEPTGSDLEAEAERIRNRDERDSRREHSPLRRAPGASVIDTTELDFDEQVEEIVRRVRAWESGAGRPD